MNTTKKPFACPSLGCNMSFANEDHLTVHKKKHDMMLNLSCNNKNNIFIVDQTPTPTRFIKNCEEVGLFQDLHHDNPFDETFRRAVENSKSVILNSSENDSLNTPNIIEHTEINKAEPYSSFNLIFSTNEKADKINFINKKFNVEDIATPKIIFEKKCEDNNNKSCDESQKTSPDKSETFLPENVNTVIQSGTSLCMNGSKVQLLLKTDDGKMMTLIAAPSSDYQIDSNNHSVNNLSTTNMPESKELVYENMQDQKLSFAKVKLKQALAKTTVTSVKNNIQQVSKIKEKKDIKKKPEKVDGKKKDLLERNRESSKRARAKRKIWIDQLQESLVTANEANIGLQQQVTNLQNQVTKLKALLLAHKDCPVTKAMEKEDNQTVIRTNVITINPNDGKPSPASADYILPCKRAAVSSEVPTISKKVPINLPIVKNTVILPKSESIIQNSKGLKTVQTIRFIAPVVANLGINKTIITLQPELQNSHYEQLKSQNMNTINSTSNIQHAASKTTGT